MGHSDGRPSTDHSPAILAPSGTTTRSEGRKRKPSSTVRYSTAVGSTISLTSYGSAVDRGATRHLLTGISSTGKGLLLLSRPPPRNTVTVPDQSPGKKEMISSISSHPHKLGARLCHALV